MDLGREDRRNRFQAKNALYVEQRHKIALSELGIFFMKLVDKLLNPEAVYKMCAYTIDRKAKFV